MLRKLLSLSLIFIIGLGCASLILILVTHQSSASTALLPPIQVGSDGLGDIHNSDIPSLAVFGNYLYAGTFYTSSNGDKKAQIWRWNSSPDWVLVDQRPITGTSALIAFKGAIYAGSWDGYIWSSTDGTTWNVVKNLAFSRPAQGIARFMTYSDAVNGEMLYASTDNPITGTQVWRTNNGSDWAKFINAGLSNNKNNSAVRSSEVFNGYLYLGVENISSGAQLWRTNGISTEVISDVFGTPQDIAISSLAVFQDKLYAGAWMLAQGVQVWRSINGQNWERINNTPFSNDPYNDLRNSLEVYDGWLYLAVGNDNPDPLKSGLQVWRTSDGSTWELVADNGFGDADNLDLNYDNAMTVFMGNLYIGINNRLGGEVWQLSDKIYRTNLPFILRR